MELNIIVQDTIGVPGIILDVNDHGGFAVLFMDVDTEAGLFWYDEKFNAKQITKLEPDSNEYYVFQEWYKKYNKLYAKYQKSKEAGTPDENLKPSEEALQKLLMKYKFWR